MSEIRTPPKKLVDLNPRWMREFVARDKPPRDGYGIEFDCPCGRGPECEWGGTICIAFANPLDGGPVSRWGREKWQRTGDTFESLTLTPSIHAVGHWHGWLRNGVLESC